MQETKTLKALNLELNQTSSNNTEVYHSIYQVDKTWDTVLNNHNILLSSGYLKSIEDYPPKGMQFRYVILKDSNNNPAGIMYFQIQYFNASQSLSDKESKTSPCFFNTFQRYLKGLVAKQVEFNTFVCGNLLLTGENGFYFNNTLHKGENHFSLVSKTAEYVQKDLNNSGINCNVCLMKDFDLQSKSQAQPLKEKDYHEFSIQPCMIMQLDNHWKNFDNYLESLHSKYRVRAKRAFKKSIHLEKRELDLQSIKQYEKEIYELYIGVAENAGFNTVNLNIGYFFGLKQHLGQAFRLFAYFNHGKMVGFYTMIENGNEAEAHFLGYDKEENLHSQLYLNTLFDIIRESINGKFQKINFSRTALEIKSSVGAIPQEMCCYMKHRNSFSNKFIRPILDYLNPEVNWKPRHPFK